MTLILSIEMLKKAARVLRRDAEANDDLTQGEALELVARAAGYTDWNTASGLLTQGRGRPWTPAQLPLLATPIGQRVLTALDNALYSDTSLVAMTPGVTTNSLTLVCADEERLRAAMRVMTRKLLARAGHSSLRAEVIDDSWTLFGLAYHSALDIRRQSREQELSTKVLYPLTPASASLAPEDPDSHLWHGLVIGLRTANAGEAAAYLAKRHLSSSLMDLVTISDDGVVNEPVSTELVRPTPNFKASVWSKFPDGILMGELECKALPVKPQLMGIQTGSPAEALAFEADAFQAGRDVETHLASLIDEGRERARREDERLIGGRPHYKSRAAAEEIRDLNRMRSFRTVTFPSPQHTEYGIDVWKTPSGHMMIGCRLTLTVEMVVGAVANLFELYDDEDLPAVYEAVRAMVKSGELHLEARHQRELDSREPLDWAASSVDRYVQGGGLQIEVASRIEDRLRKRLGW